MDKRTFILKTVRGLEFIVKEDVERIGAEVIEAPPLSGRIVVRNGRLIDFLSLKSIERIVVLLGKIRIDNNVWKKIDRLVANSELEKYFSPATSFAVSVSKIGKEGYPSPEIGRYTGEKIVSHVLDKCGFEPEVDLSSPNVNIYVEIRGKIALIGLLMPTRGSLHEASYKIYVHPASLNPIIAHALCRIARVTDGDFILDPMCGGGTIPIECAQVARVKALCTDYNPRHVRGAYLNSIHAGVDIDFAVVDATQLSSVLLRPVTKIVSNLPYGIRQRPRRGLARLYSSFFKEVSKILDQRGIVVVLSPWKKLVSQAASQNGLKVTKLYPVFHGDLRSNIIVLTKELRLA